MTESKTMTVPVITFREHCSPSVVHTVNTPVNTISHRNHTFEDYYCNFVLILIVNANVF